MAKVLIIENSPSEQVALSTLLHKYGHGCTFASSGAAGINAAKADKPDVILMGVVLPDTSGYQATRKICTDHETKHIPIIIVSSKSQPTVQVWGLRQGAKGYLSKPVEESALMAALESVLPEARLNLNMKMQYKMSGISVAEELMKWSTLKDDGVISNQQFEEIKFQILHSGLSCNKMESPLASWYKNMARGQKVLVYLVSIIFVPVFLVGLIPLLMLLYIEIGERNK